MKCLSIDSPANCWRWAGPQNNARPPLASATQRSPQLTSHPCGWARLSGRYSGSSQCPSPSQAPKATCILLWLIIMKLHCTLVPNCPPYFVGESSWIISKSSWILGESSFFVTSPYMLHHRIFTFSTSLYVVLWWVFYKALLVPIRQTLYALHPSCFVGKSSCHNFALLIFVHDSLCLNFAPLAFVG